MKHCSYISADRSRYEDFRQIDNLRIFVSEIKALCAEDEFTLVLHKHLGDIFYTIGAKDEFEKKYGRKLHFIVRPQHEFLMKLWGVTTYKVFDLDSVVKNNDEYLDYFFSDRIPNAVEKSWLVDFTFQQLFPTVPIKGMPFICDGAIVNFFKYSRYWCYRWSENMACSSDFRFSIPKIDLPLTQNAKKFCDAFGGVENIVLLAPEAQTAVELPQAFWDIIVKEVQNAGYTVAVNSKKYSFKGSICLFDYPLSLEDIVAIGLKCAFVFSLRSGLCDVLISAGRRLYSFSPAQLRREKLSLELPFDGETRCNDIQLYNWIVPPIEWNGIDLQPRLQEVISDLHKQYIKSIITRVFFPTKKNKYEVKRIENIAGISTVFNENNQENPIPKCINSHLQLGFLRLSLYSKKLGAGGFSDQRFFGGLVRIKQNPVDKKVYFAGLPVFVKKLRSRTEIKLFGLPFYSKDRRTEFFDYLFRRLKPGYDHVYIIRHNIGETFLYLSYLKHWVNKNCTSKPLVIVWRARDWSFYKMFIGQDIKVQFIPIAQSDINSFFQDDTSCERGVRFYTPTFQIAQRMKSSYEKDHAENFSRFILKSMNLEDAITVSNPIIRSKSAKLKILQIVNDWHVDCPIALLCPHANSLKSLPDQFWIALSRELKKRNYYVVMNSSSEIDGVSADVNCFLPIDELYELASVAKVVFSMASGLGVLLSSVETKLALFYTSFYSKTMGYDADLTMKIYSVKHMNVDVKATVKEFNMEQGRPLPVTEIVTITLGSE